jgi:hypothetical protein
VGCVGISAAKTASSKGVSGVISVFFFIASYLFAMQCYEIFQYVASIAIKKKFNFYFNILRWHVFGGL